MKQISVIIPTFNEERDILDCLKSLDKQSGVSFEVIVVDDGSKDKSVELAKSYKPKKYSLQVHTQDHKGAGSARNLGAKYARSIVLVFVDADMTFEKRFLKQLTAPIFAKKAKGTYSTSEYVANWDNVWARCLNVNENWPDRKRHKRSVSNSRVFRAILKSEYERVGGFVPGGYTDDWSLGDKLGYFAFDAKKAIFYHRNPSSLREVFAHARWVGKRQYKLGMFGKLVTLVRLSLPFSLVVGLYLGLRRKTVQFILYKVVYDFGRSLGVIEYLFNKKGTK